MVRAVIDRYPRRYGVLLLILASDHYSLGERLLFLLVGASCFWQARRGLSTGIVGLVLGSVKRSHSAALFWVVVVLNVLAGLAALLMFLIGTDSWNQLSASAINPAWSLIEIC